MSLPGYSCEQAWRGSKSGLHLKWLRHPNILFREGLLVSERKGFLVQGTVVFGFLSLVGLVPAEEKGSLAWGCRL